MGAGPAGLYTAIALARRGHEVVVIDRDRGPEGDQRWDRKGVMQVHHPHFFRAGRGRAAGRDARGLARAASGLPVQVAQPAVELDRQTVGAQTMDHGELPVLIGFPGVFVAVEIGVTPLGTWLAT